MSVLVKHSAVYLLTRALGGIFSFATLAIFTRLLKPEEYGQYSLVIAGTGFANALVFQWLQISLIRFFPSYREKQGVLISTVMRIFVMIAIGAALISGISMLVMPNPKWIAAVGLGTGLLWCQAWFNLSLSHSRANLNPQRYTLQTGIEASISLVAGALLVAMGFGSSGAIVGLMIGTLAVSSVSLRYWKGVDLRLNDSVLIKNLFSYGTPLAITGLLAMVMVLADRFMIQFMLGKEKVGLYSVGYDLAQRTLGGLTMVVGLAATPLTMWAMEHEGIIAARRQFDQTGKMFFAVMVPAAAGLYAIGDELIRLTLGMEFRQSASQLFPWIVAATFLQGLKSGYLDSAFYAHNKTTLLLMTFLPATLLNLTLNLFLIPAFGVIGAAYAALASHVLSFGITTIVVTRSLSMPIPWKIFLQAVFASSFMVVAIFWMQNAWKSNLFVQIACGIITYAVLAAAMDIASARKRLIKLYFRIAKK